jgi:hypothetical protein
MAKKGKGNSWGIEEDDVNENTPLSELIKQTPFRRAKDDKGHSFTLGARVPEEMNRWAMKLKEASQGTYDTISDVVRDGIYQGFQNLTVRYRCEAMQAMMSQMAIANDVDWHMRQLKMLQDMGKNLRTLCDAGQEKVAKIKLDAFMEHVTSAEDEKMVKRILGEHGIGQLL